MRKKRLVLEMALLFSAFFLTGYLGQGEAAMARREFGAVALSYLIAAIPQILLTIYVVGTRGHWDLARMGLVPFTKRDTLRTLAAFAGIFALFLFIASALSLLPSPARATLGAGFRWGLRSPSQLPLALAFSLVSGYREELFFRGYLLTRFEQIGVPMGYAVAATAVLFSIGHAYEGTLGIGMTAIQGVYLALVFLRIRSLHVVALAHGLYNFSILCFSLLTASGGP
jgi:membrane protease YdiL (CAAX protease family)